MHGITKNIGKSSSDTNISITSGDIKKALISRPNGRLGNLLLITPLLQEFTQTYPQCKIDLFVKGLLAPELFKNYDNINHIVTLPGKPFKSLFRYLGAWLALRRYTYDIVINMTSSSSSGRLSTQFAKSKIKFFCDFNPEFLKQHPDYEHIAKYPVYNFREYLKKYGLTPSDAPIPPLNLRLNETELEKGKETLHEIVKNNKKTICIFTYATGAKCYLKDWWTPFYERLKTEYADYNIIEILPKENVSQIDFKAPTFYSKDVRHIGAVIANTSLFIGADSGMMHLASASLTPTIGLFSAGNIKTYEPYSNNSTSIYTCNTTQDDWIATINNVLSKQ